MPQVSIAYEGRLRCRATHAPSGTTLTSEAAPEHGGTGAGFSPTDLVATALGTCILTLLATVAERHSADLTGARVTVEKEMTAPPSARRIARLATTVHIAQPLPVDLRHRLERIAHACPVHRSLHPDVDAPITFEWTAQSKDEG